MATAVGDDSRVALLRLATKNDVPQILKMIQQMAEFEHLTHMFVATEADLESSLFNTAPFEGPTVFILQICPRNSKKSSEPTKSSAQQFEPIFQNVKLEDVVDPQAKEFASAESEDEAAVIVGFVLFFRNYSTFMAKPGFYIEDLFVREPYRRKGFGKMMLSAVAAQAAKMGFGRVEWCVLDWNANAIKFYEQRGADVLQEWRICRLTGKALQAYAP